MSGRRDATDKNVVRGARWSIALLDDGPAGIRRTDKNVHAGHGSDKRVAAAHARSVRVSAGRRACELLERSGLMTRFIDRVLACGALLTAMRASLDTQSPTLGDVTVVRTARAVVSRSAQPSA
jgi:hypothetical protein